MEVILSPRVCLSGLGAMLTRGYLALLGGTEVPARKAVVQSREILKSCEVKEISYLLSGHGGSPFDQTGSIWNFFLGFLATRSSYHKLTIE